MIECMYGHVQALLLCAVGAVTKEADAVIGMPLRGHIHICVMGAVANCNVAMLACCKWL